LDELHVIDVNTPWNWRIPPERSVEFTPGRRG
jgi:hypothetical protein